MYVKVRVTPDAKNEQILEVSSDNFSIRVKEPAEQNLANNRVREIVAGQFRVPVARVKLVAGFRSRSKIFSIN